MNSRNWLNEIHYVILEKEQKAESPTPTWRALDFFSGGRGCIETASVVSGWCYVSEAAADELIRCITEWREPLPQGMWLVKAEANGSVADRFCVGWNSEYESTVANLALEFQRGGKNLERRTRDFRLSPAQLFDQATIISVYLNGVLQ